MKQKWSAGFTVALVIIGYVGRDPVEAKWRIDISGGAFVPTSSVNLSGESGQDAAQGQAFGGVDLDVDTDVSTDFDVDVGGSFAVGGGYSLTDYVELGGQFQSNFSGIDLGVVGNAFEVYSVTGGGRVYILPATYRFRPWAVGQIGWYRAHASSSFFGSSVTRTEDGFGANVGGGFDVAVTQLVSLGIDTRYQRLVDAFDGFDFVTTMFTVGLHFGGESTPVPGD